MISSLVLGTVQFGLSYGVANNYGQISLNNSKKILDFASKSGINILDTAIDYGDSEKYIGKIGAEQWNIITKIPKVPKHIKSISIWTRDQIFRSLDRLNVISLHAVLLHNSLSLVSMRGKEVWDTLQELKKEGVINNIGYSIYDPSELDACYIEFPPDIIQAPYNVIDNRLDSSGWLQKLNDENVDIHIRSIFMQGLLLMKQDQRPSYFDKWDYLWLKWHKWLEEENITALEATLGFVANNNKVNKMVIGVDSLFQLQEIVTLLQLNPVKPSKEFSCSDQELVNPSLWRL